MKRLLFLITLIVFVPFFLFAQEENAPEVETYFQELIKTLNPQLQNDSSIVEKKADTTIVSEKEDLPLPLPLELPEEEEIKKDPPQAEPLRQDSPVSTPAPTLIAPTIQDSPPSEESFEEAADVSAPPAPEKKLKAEKKEKKEKPERIKEEREPREWAPYIEKPLAKTRAKKKYLARLEKAPKRRMRLITFDQADIIHGRKYRSIESALMNPANLGARSEYFGSLSIIPINTLDININTSTRPFVLLEEFFSTGRLLNDAAKDSLIDMLGPNGFELPVDISMPTLFSLKMAPIFGSFYLNSGLYIKERSRIPSSFLDIVFEGATFDKPYRMTDPMGVNLNVYLKNSLGFGSYFELPGPFGEIRFGATANVYAGAFSSVNITNLGLIPSPEKTRMEAKMQILSFADSLDFFSEDGPSIHFPEDYTGIPEIRYGADIGIAWRFKLNRLLPIAPKILKNYFDVQLGIQDLGASIAMNHAYLREISFHAEVSDLLSIFNDESGMDSIMVLEDRLISADSTATMPLGTKFHVDLNYQPISILLLKGGWSTYITDGLNATAGPNYYYGAEIYPLPSFCVHGTVFQKGYLHYWEAGLKFYSKKGEFGLKARLYDLDFSLTENVSGAGIMLNWARYF